MRCAIEVLASYLLLRTSSGGSGGERLPFLRPMRLKHLTEKGMVIGITPPTRLLRVTAQTHRQLDISNREYTSATASVLTEANGRTVHVKRLVFTFFT
jgi:hypothetical protein